MAPFEKATRDFSGNTYVTLSQMFPIIANLTNSLKPPDNLSNSDGEFEEFDDNKTITSDSEESLTDQQIEVNYNDISEVLKNVKKNIYMGLNHYWAMPDDFGIMAALLDPRYKNLNFITDEETKVRIHSNLQVEYDQLKREMQQQSTPPSPTISAVSTSTSANTSRSSTPSTTRSLREYQARREQKIRKVFQTTETSTSSTLPALADEITTYFLLPVARETKNPLSWWKTKQEIFPILSIIARKYLGIPATSVASERLFSDAGNHITAKRSLLDPGLLGRMIFLKRNMQTMDHINVFPSDLNIEHNNFMENEEDEWY